MKILITGAAGFIGFHLTQAMLSLGAEVVGIDNLNDYYDPALKSLRLEKINGHESSSNFKFYVEGLLHYFLESCRTCVV